MRPQPAIEFFGSRGELAGVLGVTDTTIGYWVKRDWIPYDRQCQIQVESQKPEYAKGRAPLVASWDDVPEDRRVAA
jgi:hypothetical protein